jgi:hypothetical protein
VNEEAEPARVELAGSTRRGVGRKKGRGFVHLNIILAHMFYIVNTLEICKEGSE